MEPEREECAAKRWEGGSDLRTPSLLQPPLGARQSSRHKCIPLGVWHLTALRSSWAHSGKGVRGPITHHPDTSEDPIL